MLGRPGSFPTVPGFREIQCSGYSGTELAEPTETAGDLQQWIRDRDADLKLWRMLKPASTNAEIREIAQQWLSQQEKML